MSSHPRIVLLFAAALMTSGLSGCGKHLVASSAVGAGSVVIGPDGAVRTSGKSVGSTVRIGPNEEAAE